MDFERSKLTIVEDKSGDFARTPLTLIEAGEQPEANPPATPEEPEEPTVEPEQAESEDTLIIPVQKLTETSEDFDDRVSKAIAAIPDNVRQKLADQGWSVITCRLLGEVIQATEQPPVSWNMVSSLISFNQKEILIAESVYDTGGNEIPSLNPDGLLRNAFGHVVDMMAPLYVTEHYHDSFSDLESFKYAHTSDTTRLGADKKQKLAYYVEEGDTSRGECFAECFAALHGGGSVYTVDVMSKYFSAAMKQVKDVMDAIDTDKPIDPDEGSAGAPTPNTEQPEQPIAGSQ